MNKELTNNQKRFCQEYIKLGMNGTQAYAKVYKTKNEETAKVNESRLLTKANVQEYIKELQKKAEDKAIMSIEDRMKWLSGVVNGDIKHISHDGNGNEYENEAYMSDKMKAIDILNKMDGVYITNHKISGDVENPLNVIDLSHLSTEEIRELLKVEDKE